MAGITVKLEGIKELEVTIKDLAKRFPDSFKEQVKESTTSIERNAKKFSPVDTGRMRSSIRKDFEDQGFTGEVSANTDYAEAVEFGTSKQSDQPFLGPAFRLEQARFEKLLFNRLKDVIRRI